MLPLKSLLPTALAAVLFVATTLGAVSLPSVSAKAVAQSDTGSDATAANDQDEAGSESGLGSADEPPFMKPMMRLASIMGSVHFLRRLCGDEKADMWRQKMQALIEAQATTDTDRRRLIASFNNGYRAYESTYRDCTPAAQVAVVRYRNEGAALAREIGARYGN